MDLFQKRLLIVSGKGGVGKTTICAALARLMAGRGRKVLLVEADTRADSKARITEIFGTPHVGFDPREVYPNIFAVHLDADACMKDYVVHKVRLEMIYNAAFRLPFVRNTMNFFPGIKEFMIMHRIMRLEGMHDRSGAPRWDHIIFDGPTTGHSLFYLQCSKVLVDILRAGPFARDAQHVHDTIVNPEKTCFNVVTLAEELPVNETLDLVRNARQVLDVPLGYVFINAVQSHVFPEPNGIPAGREGIEALEADAAGRGRIEAALGGPAAAEALLECATFQTDRAEINRQNVDRLLGVPMRYLRVPFIYSRNFDLNTIDGIARTIGEGLGALAGREDPEDA